MAKLSSIALNAATAIVALSLIAATGSGQNEKKTRESKKKKAESERIEGDVKPAKAGQGIPGINVGLKKKPPGIIIQRIRTNEKGGFSFGVLPAGSYAVVIEEHPLEVMKSKNHNSSKSNTCIVVIEGGTSGPINREWVSAEETSVATSRQTQASSFGEKAFELPFESDGRTEVRGTLKTKHDTAKNSIGNIR
ncbi:MAG: carboxypeptidase regulatory-like domain-containing protein [Acidobacteria bacterium]|nr:carboxypeptidase regulatory-like domain-containing protein [Acidobacteriota bacterium]